MNDIAENDVVTTETATLKETDKKCPNCAGTMNYDPLTKGMNCPFCGYEEDIVQEEAESAAELDLESAEQTENCDWGAAKKTIHCKSCGGETIYDALEVSGECPYCGSNQVMEANDSNTMAPGGVVPFIITKDTASANFKKWIGKKFFCPKLAKESAEPESFKGLYLPYWTFDAQTASIYSGQYGKDRRVKQNDGNTKIVTDWYHTSGKYDEFFDDELVIGTNRYDNSMLRGIEPFNTADNKVYKPEYVAGFAAERYSIGVKDAWKQAKAIIQRKLNRSIESKIRINNSADHVRNLHVKTSFSKLTYKYLMLPVWVSSFKYNDKIYKFLVNGQTGKVYGKTPVSGIKVALVIGIILLIIIALCAIKSLAN